MKELNTKLGMLIRGHEVPASDIPSKVIRRMASYFCSLYGDYRSAYYLKKHATTRHPINSVIRVAFLAQMAEIWDKTEPIFEALQNNSCFDVTIIVIPPFDFVNKSLKTDYKDNYFLSKYPTAVCAYNNGTWLDLRNKFDYVFYQRPYDLYLPEDYRSANMVKYAKCCYIPYGFTGSGSFNGWENNKSFFRNIYVTFAESDYTAGLRSSIFSKKEKVLHHTVSLGYPALSPYFSIKSTNHFKRVLWTPRWSYDLKVGGSHFLEYKDTIVKLKELYSDLVMTLRPHPLLFEELIVKSLMNQEDIEQYLTILKQNNIKYDSGSPVFNTFKDTDVLITDYSSMIIQFFITGRPVIYCESNNIRLNKVFQKLAEGMYIAKDEKDIFHYVNMLQNGEDYLFDKRQEIIRVFLKIHENATDNILKWIEKDFFQQL